MKVADDIRVKALQTGSLIDILIYHTTNFDVPSKNVGRVKAGRHDRLLFAADFITPVNGSIMEKVIDRISDKLDLKKDEGPSGWGYSYLDYKDCTTGYCKVMSCDMLKFIIALSNETTRGYSSGFCLLQNPEGIDYLIYKDYTSVSANPWSIGYLPDVQVSDYSTELQRLITLALLEVNTESDVHLDVHVQKPNVKPVQLDAVPSFFGPCVFFVGLFLVTMGTHFQLNEERRRKLREAMSVMGLHDTSFWCSWCVFQTLVLFTAIVLMLIVGYACKLHFFARCNVFVLFLLFFVTGVALIAQFMCCATCCAGAVCTTLNTFTMLLISCTLILAWMDLRFIQTPNAIADFFNIGDLLPNVGLSSILNFYAPAWSVWFIPPFSFGKLMWDVNEKVHDVGLNDISLDTRFHFVDLFNFTIHPKASIPYLNWWTTAPFITLLLIALVTILLFLCACYFDNVLPRENFRPKPFYFLCLPTYWGCWRNSDYLQVDAEYAEFHKEGFVLPSLDEDLLDEFRKTMNSLHTHTGGGSGSGGDLVEEIPLKIVKMSKIYSKWYNRASANTALADMTLCVEQGKCLVIVGSNGAGKTTLVNCLIGNISPNTGDALIYGNSISLNINSVRSLIGVCPQYDIVFHGLTVAWHMHLFASIKGIPISKQKREVKKILKKVEMWGKRNQVVNTLSGGQKRRLSLALAILGQPKVLFLDEPTSGMDPSVRRKMWNLITELKKDKVVVLTTHSMQEADTLGDKIAIMAGGRLRCIGDSLHLKRRYGSGYQVDVILHPQTNAREFRDSLIRHLDPSSASSIVISEDGEIPGGIKLEAETAQSLTFSIPHVVTEMAMKFLERVEELCDDRQGVIRGYTLSHTTLEDVFMKTIHGSRSLLANLHRREQTSLNMLKVCVKDGNTEIPVGHVEIQNNWTLNDVREYVEVKYGVRPDFLFTVGGNSIPKEGERELLANKYLPTLCITYSVDPGGNPGQLEGQPMHLQEEVISISGRLDVEEEQKQVIMQQKEKIGELEIRVSQMADVIKVHAGEMQEKDSLIQSLREKIASFESESSKEE